MVKKTVLPNGLRVISEEIPHTCSVSLGIWVEVGSRDENLKENGISHFIEHMIFKGTETRSALRIAKEMDAIGGLSNAFTTKENTCFFGRILDNHLPQWSEVLSDIFLRSAFDPVEMDRARLVILQEISQMEDTPDELVHELFNQHCFLGNPLARPILGTVQNVQEITRQKILAYQKEAYQPEKIVIAAAGRLNHDHLLELMGPDFASLVPAPDSPPRREKPGIESCTAHIEKDLEQVHLCLGAPAPSLGSPDRYRAALLQIILGGNMSSRLFQEIREKRGLAYTISAYIHSFVDSGVLGIYTAMAPESVLEALKVIRQELVNFKKGRITPEELVQAKEFSRAGLLLSTESNDYRMTRLAHHEMIFGRILTIEEILEDLNRVTVEEIAELASQLFKEENLCLVTLGPSFPGRDLLPAGDL